jgi:N-acetylmuramic acid 6-phosphate (MurNAc-6-P) etherase
MAKDKLAFNGLAAVINDKTPYVIDRIDYSRKIGIERSILSGVRDSMMVKTWNAVCQGLWYI